MRKALSFLALSLLLIVKVSGADVFKGGSNDTCFKKAKGNTCATGPITPPFSNALAIRMNSAADNSQYVEGPTCATVLGATSGSAWVSIWVRWESGHTPVNLDSIVGSATNWTIWGDGFNIYWGGNDDLRVWFNSATFTFFYNNLGAPVATGTWFHLVAQYDGSEPTATDRVSLYLNGSELVPDTVASVGATMTCGGDIRLGGAGDINQPPGGFGRGDFDELGIGTGVLSTGDVTTLFGGGTPATSGSPSNTPGVALHWRNGDDATDDATAGTGLLNDQTSNNNDGIPRATTGNASFITP